jgi:predicted nucleic acid-binding protein
MSEAKLHGARRSFRLGSAATICRRHRHMIAGRVMPFDSAAAKAYAAVAASRRAARQPIMDAECQIAIETP